MIPNPSVSNRRWPVSKRVTAGFVAVVAVICLLGAFAAYSVVKLGEISAEITDDNIPSLELISTVDRAATQNRLVVYKHVSSSDPADMARLEEQFAANSKTVSAAIDEYAKHAISTEDHRVLETIQSARKAYLAKITQILELSRKNTDNAATYKLAREELDPIAQQYSAALRAATDYEQKDVDSTATAIRDTVHVAKIGIAVGIAIAILLGIGIGLLIVRTTNTVLRSVSASLHEGAQQVTEAAGQLSSASQALAEGSTQQAAALEESSAALEEMASMTNQNATAAKKATDLARQARESADAGARDMQAMSAAMADIKSSSDDIAKIIKTIDEIAFQTNILSLNAAVEAARAGEAGMGFAVVADEVRNLAQRSAQSAKETASKIEGAIQKTAQGVQLTTKVAGSLTDIVDKVRQVDTLVAEVANASREQSTGTTQITSAVNQMDKVVQSNTSAAEESAAAAEELNSQAISLTAAVGELNQLAGLSQTTELRTRNRRAPAPAPTPRKSSPAAPRPSKTDDTLVRPSFGTPALAVAGANGNFFADQ